MPWLGKRESWRVPVQACTPQRMTAELAGRISPQLAASSFHQPSLRSLHTFTCTRPANISTQTIRGCLSLHPCDHLELTMAKAMPFFLLNPSLPALSSGSPHQSPLVPWCGAGPAGPLPPSLQGSQPPLLASHCADETPGAAHISCTATALSMTKDKSKGAR